MSQSPTVEQIMGSLLFAAHALADSGPATNTTAYSTDAYHDVLRIHERCQGNRGPGTRMNRSDQRLMLVGACHRAIEILELAEQRDAAAAQRSVE